VHELSRVDHTRVTHRVAGIMDRVCALAQPIAACTDRLRLFSAGGVLLIGYEQYRALVVVRSLKRKVNRQKCTLIVNDTV